MKAPRLRLHISVVAHSADVVELRDGVWNPVSVTLSDDEEQGTLTRIVRLVDGDHTPSEIARQAGASRSQVEGVLDRLRELRLVEDDASSALDHYVERALPTLLPFGGRPSSENTGAVVLGFGEVAAEIATHLDRALGAGTAELHTADSAAVKHLLSEPTAATLDGFEFEEWCEPFAEWRGRHLVWASDVVRPDHLRMVNRLALHLGITWIHACADGPFLLIGPTFVPGRTACYECLDLRVLMNLREARSYQRYKEALADGRASGRTAPLDSTLASMLAAHTSFEVLNMLTTGAGFTVGRMLAVYLPTMEFAFNEVLRVPGCGACASEPESHDHELYFDIKTLLADRGT